MKKLILPLSLVLSLIVIFVGGIIVAENVAKNRNNVIADLNDPLRLTIKEFFPEFKSFKEVSDVSLIQRDEQNYVKGVYDVFDNKDTLIGNAFVVVTVGYKPNFEIFVGIDSINRKVVGFKELAFNETWLDQLPIWFREQFIEADITKGSFDFLTLATSQTPQGLPNTSSKAIIFAVKLAREQFYQIIGEALPISFLVKSSTQSFTDFSLFTYKFDSKEGEFSIGYSFDFSNKLTFVDSTKDLTEDEKQICLSLAEKALPKVFITSVTGDILSITGSGYAGKIIAKITIENKAITKFIIEEENESYESPYNNFKGPDPFDNILSFIANQDDPNNIQIVQNTGATVTASTLKNMFVHALNYIKEVK